MSFRFLLPVALAILLPLSCSREGVPPARSVVLVSLDTLRADRLGAYGNPTGTSPHLDRLARRGVSFDRCIAQSTMTTPSHRSLFQSREASAVSKQSPVLAECFRDSGFATAAFTGGGNISAKLGFARGFDRSEETPDGLGRSIGLLDEWLDGVTGGRFFAFLHTYGVHLPYSPPSALEQRFDPGYKGDLRGDRTRVVCRQIRRIKEYADFQGEVGLSEADRRHLLALYDAEIRSVDSEVGRLLRLLDERDLAGRTVVAIASDHGEEFFDHGSVLHSHTLYQELVHVPLILRIPGGASGVRVPNAVRNLDIAPTLLELAGVAAPESFRGVSLLRRVRGERPRALPAASEIRGMKSWIEDSWKVVSGPGGTELFDLAADPGETRNLAVTLPEKADSLLAAAARALGSGMEEEVSDRPPEDLDPELADRLRALGYID
ncbi:MAG: sulfatase [Gemmatimonadota bacterium]|jgi:arylsulfatase A-like enzyme|nr:sulfatase [Gemmatimonadota bacterium]MDP6802775.1 sulfatase [Gemmatimonadota bacterium]